MADRRQRVGEGGGRDGCGDRSRWPCGCAVAKLRCRGVGASVSAIVRAGASEIECGWRTRTPLRAAPTRLSLHLLALALVVVAAAAADDDDDASRPQLVDTRRAQAPSAERPPTDQRRALQPRSARPSSDRRTRASPARGRRMAAIERWLCRLAPAARRWPRCSARRPPARPHTSLLPSLSTRVHCCRRATSPPLAHSSRPRRPHALRRALPRRRCRRAARLAHAAPGLDHARHQRRHCRC